MLYGSYLAVTLPSTCCPISTGRAWCCSWSAPGWPGRGRRRVAARSRRRSSPQQREAVREQCTGLAVIYVSSAGRWTCESPGRRSGTARDCGRSTAAQRARRCPDQFDHGSDRPRRPHVETGRPGRWNSARWPTGRPRSEDSRRGRGGRDGRRKRVPGAAEPRRAPQVPVRCRKSRRSARQREHAGGFDVRRR